MPPKSKAYMRNELREVIVAEKERGKTNREIAAFLNISHGTVGNIWNHWKSTGTVHPNPKSGRPQKTSPQFQRSVCRASRQDADYNGKDVQVAATSIGLSISRATACRILQKKDLNGRRAAKVSFISEENRIARFQWCQEHKNWTFEKWCRVVFSDESRMSHNMTYDLRKRNTKLNYKDRLYSKNASAQKEVIEIVNATKSKNVCIKQPKEMKAKSKIVRSCSLEHSKGNRIASTQIQDMAYTIVNKPSVGIGQPNVFETANCTVSHHPESVWASSMNCRYVKQEKYLSHVMSETKSATNSKWVRLNVGGKVFQTKNDTLSRYPESFLASLVNGDPSSEKDESGAYLIDGNPEHFDTILTFLRRGVLNLDGNEKTAKDLLCEADFYNIQPLVDEIRKAIRPVPSRTEIIIVARVPGHVSIGEQNIDYIGCLAMSEKRENYEVLQALRQKIEIKADECYYITSPDSCDTWLNIESILRSFDFVKEEISDVECWDTSMCEKFVRRIFE